MTVFSGLVSKIGYNIEEAAARQRVFYYQVKILWYFSNWYQVNICFCQIITRWNILIFFFLKFIPGEYFFLSNYYQVKIFWYFSKIDTRWVCFLQIITRWKHFGMFFFFKLISGKFVLFKLLPGEFFLIFLEIENWLMENKNCQMSKE